MTEKEWFEAIKFMDIEKIKKMVINGFDLNVTTYSSMNALHCIGQNRSFDAEKAYQLAEFLIKHNINIEQKNMYGVTPLIQPIIITRFPEITELLIDSGANIHQEDVIGNNILTLSIYANNKKLVKKLLDLGMDINHVDKKGKTAAELIRNTNDKYKIYRHLMSYKHLLCQKQKDIIEKEKLRMLFR